MSSELPSLLEIKTKLVAFIGSKLCLKQKYNEKKLK
jgi:hypothetical protein